MMLNRRTLVAALTSVVTLGLGFAAYAAAEAAVLPVDAQSTMRAPSSSAFATATTIPRSLNEPVGF